MSTTTPVIALDHPAALDVARVGRKAADLAAARAAGLPVAPGVVLTTDWASGDRATAAQVWRITSHDGARPLVVRPSAVTADRRRAAQHGAVEPATIVADLDAMLSAVASLRADDATTPVLLQPHVAAAWRGVLFADPDTHGWRATSLAVVRCDDHDLDWVAELDHHGRVRDVMSAVPAAGPPVAVLDRLSRLAHAVAATFGGAHDLEWVADEAGRLQLLRVRPIVHLRGRERTGAAVDGRDRPSPQAPDDPQRSGAPRRPRGRRLRRLAVHLTGGAADGVRHSQPTPS